MLTIVAAALVGGPLTSALLWGHGPVLALLCAPVGGSVAGLAAAVLVSAFHGEDGSAPAAARRSAPHRPLTLLR